MELLGHKVVADTIQAADRCGTTACHGGDVLHNVERETGSFNALHYEPGK